ncbi:HSP90 family protein [Brachybacterium sp. J144]|uniref:HSP90 family protein n=1 Tax=Brachybacterium sp. J144 TaxID=3116487 RepID=UPI002E787C08|nr:HSP90 family protein [Brachybacterium sp. J144]MEE1650237.1 HSP90 family protein [Brachybacterium sp. J144]
MAGTTENFQVDLRGIVEILSHNLYSSPRVYVRELIQNARDAVVARGETGEDLPPIELLVDPVAGALTVRDHGIGLTEAEARSLLSTIGASSKREELAAARREFLGQFGIGLLSCFLVADQIEVTSRSARDPEARTMRWVGRGDGTFTVTPAPEQLAEPGTEVRVHVRPDEAEWVGADRVTRLASEYASLLAVPITVAVAGDPAPPLLVSRNPAPWDLPEGDAATWCADAFGFEPLAAIPLHVPMLGVRGVAFVTPQATPGRGRAGDRVFSHGMSVASDNTQLVPEWVAFARVALEAGSLGLTASRESLHESGSLATAREEIGRQIRAGIEQLAAGDPAVFARFVDAHGSSLIALAVAHAEMLEFVARHLTWETSVGLLRLVEMPARIAYTTDDREFATYAPLVQAQGGLLVNGAYTHGGAMLRAYGESQTRLTAREFELSRLLEDLPGPRAEDAGLAERIGDAAQAVLGPLGVAVDVRAFRPATQLVLHVPRRAPGFAFEEVEDDPWADLLGGGAAVDPVGPADSRPALVLNLRAEAVRALGGRLTPSAREGAIRALHLLSLLQAGIRLHAEEQASLAVALETLLLAAARSEDSPTADGPAGNHTTDERGRA